MKKILLAASYKLLQRNLKSFFFPQMTYYFASSQKISQDVWNLKSVQNSKFDF